jgi:predicted Ser/Thr protein kinase
MLARNAAEEGRVQCVACQTPLAEQVRFCPVCGELVRPDVDVRAGDPIRRLLERTLADRYELLRVLGRGGMGIVYLARERELERLVAIKVLSPELSSTAESRERFRREARTAAKLNHPGILPLHTFGEAEELAYLVMEYVRGESLAELLRQEGRLPPDTTRRIIAELADALDYAHRHGVVHRDIKPENVLIEDESGRAYLADFGIAKARASEATLTITGAIVGTLPYMSPEQAAGDRSVDGRSDIYSLGVLGYTILSGRLPFEGRGMREILVRQATQPPPPLESLVPGVPEDLASAISRCLVKDPDGRWPDAKSLRQALIAEETPETGLPDDLREIATFGTWAILWLVIWSLLAYGEYTTSGDLLLFVLVALLVPVGLALQIWNVLNKGFSLQRVLRVACWPPKWWGLWWPRPVRRPSDVWDRLPRSVRLTRLMLTAFFILAPALKYAERRRRSAAGPPAGLTINGFHAAEYAFVAAVALFVAVSLWRLRGRGIPTADLARVLVGPTAAATFWSSPGVTALLEPRPTRDLQSRFDTPLTPHELLRAISDAAERLAGAPRALGTDAVAAARQLFAGVELLDGEISMLARDADPAEVARLEQRLAAGDDISEDPDEQQMRMLLRRQLELLSRLLARLESATTQRERLVTRLRELWGCVRALHTESADGDARGAAERIALICMAAEREASGVGAGGLPSPTPMSRSRR